MLPHLLQQCSVSSQVFADGKFMLIIIVIKYAELYNKRINCIFSYLHINMYAHKHTHSQASLARSNVHLILPISLRKSNAMPWRSPRSFLLQSKDGHEEVLLWNTKCISCRHFAPSPLVCSISSLQLLKSVVEYSTWIVFWEAFCTSTTNTWAWIVAQDILLCGLFQSVANSFSSLKTERKV